MTSKKSNKGKGYRTNNYNKNECEHCPHIIKYKDKPNEFGGLKFRAAYVFVSFFVLGFNQSVGVTFFTSLLMFAVPLFYDLMRFSPRENSRVIIKRISMSFLLLHIGVALLGMLGVIECIEQNSLLYIMFSNKNLALQGVGIRLSYFWWSILGEVLFTIADTIVATPMYVKMENNSVGVS